MATEKYGTTQFKDIFFNNSEIKDIIRDYVRAKNLDDYDFDGAAIVIITPKDNNGLIVRMFQKEFTTEEKPRGLTLTRIRNDNDKVFKERKVL